MRRFLQGVLPSLIVVALGGGALAEPPNKCSAFVVMSDGSGRKVTYVDHPPVGKSIGDQRIGYRVLKDANGNQVGESRWINTAVEVAPSPDQKDLTTTQYAFQFPAGAIVAVRPAAPARASFENTRKMASSGDRIALGGSGVFQGAYGTLKIKREAGKPNRLAFDISCD